MSRPIKFRVWAEENKQHFFEYFNIGENEDRYGRFAKLANEYGSIIEQYTGLKDKNGKEIYEGDVVKGDMGVFEVKWYYEIARFSFVPNIDMECHQPFVCDQVNKMEVIGNIHETPELLGGGE